MSPMASVVPRRTINSLLVIAALLSVFGALAVVADKGTAYVGVKLVSLLVCSALCLLLTRERASFDAFCAAVAGLATLFAIAITAGDHQNPNFEPSLIGASSVAVLFTMLTRNKRQTILAIVMIVAFRLLVFVVVYALS